MSSLIDLIGSEVLDQGGETFKSDLFQGDGKVLGLYFSAHWCPPCRGFTPQLAEFYKKVKGSPNGDKFDIVFVSSDRDEESFNDYFKEMPWKALPFSDRDRKGKLSKKFKVSGIPTLVFIDGNGKTITADGRAVVGDDPEGQQFPWTPKTFKEIFTGKVVGKDGAESTLEDATRGKIIGLYFSAHWCPPCKAFTPVLDETYKKLKESGKNFEVIFLSSDRSEESFNDYYASMPWLALPYDDKRKKDLSRYFDIAGIPTLILLDEEQQVITKNGRGAVMSDKLGAKFPWIPAPLSVLDGDSVSAVNETTCVIFFTDGQPANVNLAKECLEEIATSDTERIKKKKKLGEDVDDEILYFCEGEDDDESTADSLRTFLNLEERSPMVLLLDIPNGKKYVLPESETLSKERLKELTGDFRTGKLAMLELRQ